MHRFLFPKKDEKNGAHKRHLIKHLPCGRSVFVRQKRQRTSMAPRPLNMLVLVPSKQGATPRQLTPITYEPITLYHFFIFIPSWKFFVPSVVFSSHLGFVISLSFVFEHKPCVDLTLKHVLASCVLFGKWCNSFPKGEIEHSALPSAFRF